MVLLVQVSHLDPVGQRCLVSQKVPLNPVNPCGPLGPVKPGRPGGPVKPVHPRGPLGPVEPAKRLDYYSRGTITPLKLVNELQWGILMEEFLWKKHYLMNQFYPEVQ